MHFQYLYMKVSMLTLKKSCQNQLELRCFNEVKDASEEKNLDLFKLTEITTDGAPAMVGQKNGLIGLLHTVLKTSKKTTYCIKL